MSDEKTAKRRVTLRDVAQAAGVSLKTASNVINGSGRMTDETRTKVETVIKEVVKKVPRELTNFDLICRGSFFLLCFLALIGVIFVRFRH